MPLQAAGVSKTEETETGPHSTPSLGVSGTPALGAWGQAPRGTPVVRAPQGPWPGSQGGGAGAGGYSPCLLVPQGAEVPLTPSRLPSPDVHQVMVSIPSTCLFPAGPFLGVLRELGTKGAVPCHRSPGGPCQETSEAPLASGRRISWAH